MLHKTIRWLKAKLPHRLKQKLKEKTGLGSTAHDTSVFTKIDLEKKMINIAIHVGGGLGDFVVYKAIFTELLKIENCCLSLFTLSYENTNTIIGNMKNIHIYYAMAYRKKMPFDVFLEIDHYIKVKEINISSLKKKSKALYEMLNKIIQYNEQHIPSTNNVLTQRNSIIFRAKYLGLNRWSQLSCGGIFDMSAMRSQIELDINRKEIIAKYGLVGNGYITISCGADIDMGGMKQTKIWPIDKYSELTLKIKTMFPKLKVVQLAQKNEPHAKNVDVVIQENDFENVKILLSEAKTHVSNEGGLVHVATQLGIQCIVIFGPTPVHYYGYPSNINIESPFCSGCMEVNYEWFTKCPRSFEKAMCMDNISVEMVFNALKNIL